MTKTLSLLVAAAIALAATPAFAGGPVSGPQAKSHVTSRFKYSSAVKDKSKPWTFKLGGKKGDVIRPYTASNERTFAIDPLTTGVRGNRVEGTLNTQTGAVRTTNVQDVGLYRNAPSPRDPALTLRAAR